MRRHVFARAAASVLALCIGTHERQPAHALDDEPEAAQRLFELVSGRRPSSSWSPTERASIEALIDDLAALRLPWSQAVARGKWRLAYLQPAMEGERPPFLGLPFNEQFTIYSRSDLINVAELLGPSLEVRAAGAWREDDPDDVNTPKRYRTDVEQGAICVAATIGRAEKANIGRACAPLPISQRSESYRVVESLYVGARVRVDRDINSGGTRVVQVRVTSFSGR